MGKPASKPESLSCFKDSEEWIMQEVNDRQRLSEKRRKEKDIVRKIYGSIKIRLK